MTHLEEDPNTMNSYDRFWRMAYRDLYRNQGPALTAIEMAGLLPLKIQWEGQGQDDRWHAAVGEPVRPLSLARFDAWAEDTCNGILSPNYSMQPEEAS